MNDLTLLAMSLGVKLLAVALALLIVVPAAIWFSAYLDRRAGVNFRDAIKIMYEDPLAAAEYHGRRIGYLFLAVAIAVGLALQ